MSKSPTPKADALRALRELAVTAQAEKPRDQTRKAKPKPKVKRKMAKTD